MAAKRRLLILMVAFAALPAFAQPVLTITSPADQAHLRLTDLEFFNLTWTCTEWATQVEIWVDGTPYCSLCGSGLSGSYTLDSWLDPPFYGTQCGHTLHLRALVGAQWVYSEPVVIYDTAWSYSTCLGTPCPTTMGGPVDVATGKMYYEQEDLRIEGPLPLVFARRYVHKNRNTLGTFGYGWTHSYNLSLTPLTGAMRFRNAEGRDILFPKKANGWDNNRRDHLTLATIAGGYRITTKEQTKYTFNTAGRLTTISDRNGDTVTLAYDGSNRLSTVTDSFGRSFTLAYTAGGRVDSLTDGTRTVTYAYTDGQNNLNGATYPGAQTWAYAYGATPANHRLATVTDPMGHTVEAIAYNASDKVLTWERQGGEERLTFAYPSATQTRVTNSVGVLTTFTVDQYNGVVTAVTGPGCSSCGSGTNESYLLDAWFNKTQVTDGNGNVTKQTFDGFGDVLSKTEAFGTTVARTTAYTYHPTYHFTATVTAPSVDTGGQNRVESYTYDGATGDLLSETLSGYSDGSPFSHATSYTYNDHGLVLTEDGPGTDVSDITTFTYYADGDADPNKRGRLNTVTNALGHVTAVNSYTVSGKPTVTIDPNNVERDDCYDALDRFCGVTIKGATPAEDITTTYTLNGDGLPDSVTLPNGNVVTYTRDALHRLTEITDALGNKTVYNYDTESRKTREEYRDPGAVVTKFTNFGYDSYNRLQYAYFNSVVPPGLGSIYYEYGYDNAGNRTFEKDPLGHLTCFEYDALNRKTKTHQYLGTAPAACLGTCTAPGCVDLLTQFGYDTQDHLTSVTDPGGLVTTYAVDDAGAMIRQVSPDTGTTTYTHDEAENLKTKTDANGITETRNYDALNRLTAMTYPDTSNNVAYSYDSPQASFGIGRRTGMTDPAGTSTFSFDRVGRLTQENRTPSSQPNAFTQYSWDKNGNLTGIAYPSGRQAAFTINTGDQVTGANVTINGASVPIASTIAYMPFGPRNAMTFGNGLVDGRTFDSRYRLGTWTLGALVSKTYGWQDDDNITGITDNLNPANNRAFGYDAIHRLTTGNGPWGAGSYSYDANGNRLTKTEGAIAVTYTYTPGTNRLATATGSEPGSYGYDSNGNTTGDGTYTYQYSQRDRFASVDGGATGSYSYDGDGRRVKKTAGGVTTLFFYDPEGRLLEEYIPATSTGKDYIWLPGSYEPIARVDFTLNDADTGDVLRATKASPNVHLNWTLFGGSGNFVTRRGAIGDYSSFSNLNAPSGTKTLDDPVLADGLSYWYDVRNRTLADTLYFYHADHLGTPIAMTNTAGALAWRAEHFPFGAIYALPVSTITNNLRFPGQYYDGETNASDNFFRTFYHLPARFFSADPIGLKGGINLYTSCDNNTIVAFDRLGLSGTYNPYQDCLKTMSSKCKWVPFICGRGGYDEGEIRGFVQQCHDISKRACKMFPDREVPRSNKRIYDPAMKDAKKKCEKKCPWLKMNCKDWFNCMEKLF